MSKTIWKFPVAPKQKSISMPKGAEVLSVQEQHGMPCIWALVDPSNKTEERHFEIFGTGHDIPMNGERKSYQNPVKRKYIGTFQLQGGSLVFHLFERLN